MIGMEEEWFGALHCFLCKYLKKREDYGLGTVETQTQTSPICLINPNS